MSSFFTSESVTEGHPDKICDQISDAILDDILTQDEHSRVACEVAVKTGLVFVFGEIRTSGFSDTEKIARKVIREIGYDRAKYGFDYETCGVMTSIGSQSDDIAVGVDEAGAHELGAGDQGMMFGYACDETPEYMPLPIMLAHTTARQLSRVRKDGTLPYLRPDGKTQITVEYDQDRPVRVGAVVVSSQHAPNIPQSQIHSDIREHVIDPILKKWIDDDTIFHINPTGQFIVGGPLGDAGLTGRKIIVDTYGGAAPHGGGAFSGKDPTKVDRSGAYIARYIAKNIVAAKLARRCLVQLSYAIGVAEPVSLLVNTFGTGKKTEQEFEDLVRDSFPLKPKEIIDHLELRKPIYQKTAAYGHFGREEFSWEKIDIAANLSS